MLTTGCCDLRNLSSRRAALDRLCARPARYRARGAGRRASAGGMAVTRSGGEPRWARKPASGPQATARSTSPLRRARMMPAGELSSAVSTPSSPTGNPSPRRSGLPSRRAAGSPAAEATRSARAAAAARERAGRRARLRSPRAWRSRKAGCSDPLRARSPGVPRPHGSGNDTPRSRGAFVSPLGSVPWREWPPRPGAA